MRRSIHLIFLFSSLFITNISAALEEPPRSDFTGDGFVDFYDLSLMAGKWLEITPENLNMLGYYKLDEISGTIAADSSGNNNTGLLYGNPVWLPTEGETGGTLELDGSGDYVKTADNSNKLQLSNDYTIAVWVKAAPNQNNWAGFVIKAPPDGSTTHWGMQFNASESIVVYHNLGPSWNTGITLSNVSGSWHHVTIVRDGSTMKSYLNSIEVGSTIWSTEPGNGLGHLNIGTDRGAWCYYTGLIDEVRIYDFVLSQSEIADLAKVADLSDDGEINFKDFSILANDWLWPNELPGKACEPEVPDGVSGVSRSYDLSWTAGSYAVSHDVYFGTDPTPDAGEFQGNPSGTSFDPGIMAAGITYYWRVDQKNPSGTTTGEVWSFTTGATGAEAGRAVENGWEFFSDSFDSPSGDWQGVYLEGSTGGSYLVSGGELVVGVAAASKMYGVYNTMPVSGHFYAEVEFEDDNDVGLALIQEKDGVPDINNFTMIFVDTNSAGKVLVKLHDRQDGVDDVLDNTNNLGEERYEHTLDGSRYSLPFVGTNKKLRILRDGPAGFFHLYYAVKAYIHDDWTEGWIELAPSRDWAGTGTKYYVALVAGSGSSSAEVRFDNVRAIQKPRGDRDDSVTGFEAFRGEYNWSGFFGDAVVITFGDDFAYRGSGRKFVFWSEANYIPGWHMNNQLLYSYEFLETWGGDVVGCHEPMSDRMRRWSSVEVLEDNEVRKVVHWHYVLCNPDYQVPRDWQGTELPEGDEYWTFYPDGTGLRHIVYTPKLDTSFRNGHELMELIPIAGSLTDPVEHMVHPALTVMNLDGDVNTYHLDPLTTGPYNEQTSNWDQVIAAAHFVDGPDAFCVFSHSSDVPETYSYYNIEFDISWHNTGRFRLVHWPVGLEPYIESDGIKTHATWTAEVAHACLMGGGVYNEGQDWTDHYQVDALGREYREWVSLVGLSEPGNLEELRDRTETWLYPGTVTMLNPSSVFEGVNYKQRELVFNNTGGDQVCEFNLLPGSTNVVNPSFKIKGWGDNPVSVSVNGFALTVGVDFRRAIEGSDALVWIKGEFDSSTTFSISDST